MVFALLLAAPSGIMASVNQNSHKDYLFTLLADMGISIPGFCRNGSFSKGISPASSIRRAAAIPLPALPLCL
jgi:hypothetical protein